MKKLKQRLLSFIVAFSIAISGAGCGKKENNETIEEKLEITEEENGRKTAIAQAKVEELLDGTLYVKEYNVNNHTYIIAYSNDEIREYLEEPNPTFEDVRKSIENNKNIEGIVKYLILTYVDILEESNPTADLSVFNYNMKLLNIVLNYEDMEDIDCLDEQSYAVAKFDPNTHTIYMKEDVQIHDENWLSSFMHELAHAEDTTKIQKDNTTIERYNYLKIVNEKGEMEELGGTLYEGSVEFYTYKICNYNHIPYGIDKINYKISGYLEYCDIFSILNIFSEKDLYYFQEHGMVEFINSLYKNGIKDPVSLIKMVDSSFENNHMRLDIYTELFQNKTDYWLANDYSNSQIYNNVDNYFSNTFMEKYITAGDFIIDTYFGMDNQIIKSEIDKVVKNKIGERIDSDEQISGNLPINPSYDYQNPSTYKIEVGSENLFLYEDPNHYILWCYKIELESGLVIYYDTETDSRIDESTIICGELLSVLQEEGIVILSNKKTGVTSVEVDPESWTEYFEQPKHKVFQYK